MQATTVSVGPSLLAGLLSLVLVGAAYALALGWIARRAFAPRPESDQLAGYGTAWLLTGVGVASAIVWRIRSQQQALGFDAEALEATAPLIWQQMGLLALCATGMTTAVVARRMRADHRSVLPEGAGGAESSAAPSSGYAVWPMMWSGAWSLPAGGLVALLTIAVADFARLFLP